MKRKAIENEVYRRQKKKAHALFLAFASTTTPLFRLATHTYVDARRGNRT